MPKNIGYSNRIQKGSNPSVGTAVSRLGKKGTGAGLPRAPISPPPADQYKESANAARVPKARKELGGP